MKNNLVIALIALTLLGGLIAFVSILGSSTHAVPIFPTTTVFSFFGILAAITIALAFSRQRKDALLTDKSDSNIRLAEENNVIYILGPIISLAATTATAFHVAGRLLSNGDDVSLPDVYSVIAVIFTGMLLAVVGLLVQPGNSNVIPVEKTKLARTRVRSQKWTKSITPDWALSRLLAIDDKKIYGRFVRTSLYVQRRFHDFVVIMTRCWLGVLRCLSELMDAGAEIFRKTIPDAVVEFRYLKGVIAYLSKIRVKLRQRAMRSLDHRNERLEASRTELRDSLKLRKNNHRKWRSRIYLASIYAISCVWLLAPIIISSLVVTLQNVDEKCTDTSASFFITLLVLYFIILVSVFILFASVPGLLFSIIKFLTLICISIILIYVIAVLYLFVGESGDSSLFSHSNLMFTFYILYVSSLCLIFLVFPITEVTSIYAQIVVGHFHIIRLAVFAHAVLSQEEHIAALEKEARDESSKKSVMYKLLKFS